jgi:hypothetical protein
VAIKATGATLLYNEIIQVRVKYTVKRTGAQKYGMMVFDNEADAKALDPSKAITHVEYDASALTSGGYFYGYSDGIPAKDMGTTLYYVGYAQYGAEDYEYAEMINYSPRVYAANMLGKSTTADATKNLCSALMHYGAAMQQYKDKSLTAEQLMNYGIEGIRAIPYDEAVLGDHNAVITRGPNEPFKLTSATMLFEGAITYRLTFTVPAALVGKVYVEYTIKGVTNETPIEQDGSKFYAFISGNAAKDMDEDVTVRAYYLDENENKVYDDELVYSGYAYVRNTVKNSSDATSIALAKAFAMYIYYADKTIK